MITVVCTDCKHAINVIGEVAEVDHLVGQHSDFWPNGYKCWTCSGQMTGFLTPEVSAAAMRELYVYELGVQEAYAALMGLGIPDERVCTAESVMQLFESAGLQVKGKTFRGQHRYFIDEIQFPDGTKLHLGASPQGAAVYRITKPHSYVKANDVG